MEDDIEVTDILEIAIVLLTIALAALVIGALFC